MKRDWIQRWSLYVPNKVAINEYETGRSVTYKQLDTLGRRIGAWLKSMGIEKGARVAVLAENCLEYFFLYAAALKTGIILVPFNFRFAAREINHLLSDSLPSLVIAQEKFQPMLEECEAYRAVPNKISLTDFTSITYPHRDQTFAVGEVLDEPELFDHDPIFILYTSGTTGFPKGALYTHGMMFWNALNTALRLNLTEHDRTVVFLPLFHTGAWNVFATPFLYFGASFCLMKNFHADNVLAAVEAQKMTVIMGVPTTLKMMASSASFATADLSSVRYAIVGGEPMPVPLIETWHERGIAIRQGFGMTEVGPNLFSLHQDDATRKIGSIGLPNFYVETRVVDDDDNDVLPDEHGNRSGELLIRGPMTTIGYWNNPKATMEALRGGWFHTGDIVRQDSEGYFFVVDRKKNMYISGGENVYPAEVEKFLFTHDAIADVAIIGVADEKWGEVGKAFIVIKAGYTLSEEDVLAYCRQGLAKYKIPKYVEFLPELPKNDTGKINRLALKRGE
jgi:fatty-acyl-CoA synthase